MPSFIGNITKISGRIGVHLFFVLSGYLIGRIFLKDVIFNKNNIRYKILNFWIRRWLRTLPNYYLWLIIYILLVCFNLIPALSINNIDIYKYIFFLQSFYKPDKGFFIQSWSLCVEEWFYLLLPLTALLFMRNKKYIFLKIFLSYVFLVFAKTFLLPETFKIGVFNHLDEIMIGVALSALKYTNLNFTQKYKIGIFYLGLVLFLAAIFIYIKFIVIAKPVNFYTTVISILQSFSFAMFINFFEQKKFNQENFLIKIFKIISLSSYSLYLSHFLVLYFFITLFLFKIPFLNYTTIGRWLTLFIFITTNATFSYINYKYFELPLLNFRDSKNYFIKKYTNSN